MRQVYKPLSAIVQTAADELGLNVLASDVLASNDRITRQLGRLTVEACEILLGRNPWRSSPGDGPWVKKANEAYAWYLDGDSDTPLIDYRTIVLGIKWSFLAAKGLTYSEIFGLYEVRINQIASASQRGSKVDLNVP